MLRHVPRCPRDGSDAVHPNLTLPDPTPLNHEIHKLRQESEELLNKMQQRGNHSDLGDVDGKNTFVTYAELFSSCLKLALVGDFRASG